MIYYNIDNYINIICSNRIHSITIYEAYHNMNQNNLIRKPVEFKDLSPDIYIYIFLQNLVIISTLQNYLNGSYKLLFKAIISAFIFLCILILFISRAKKFYYFNLVHQIHNILLLYCSYQILFDFIIMVLKYSRKILIN